MRVYVMTSDTYLPAVRPFLWLFDKYWPDQPVTICGFTAPDFELPAFADFLSLGEFRDYPVNRWSDALLKLLSVIPDEPFALMLEDYWLIKPVPTDVIRMLYDYCRQFGYVCRMDLTGDRLHARGASLYGQVGHVDLIWSDPQSQYHMSLMTAIWNKHNLRRVLVPGETPWEVELNGTPRMRAMKDEMIVLGSRVWPVRHTLAFRGGDSGKLLLDEIDPADVEEMRQLGLLKPWGVE